MTTYFITRHAGAQDWAIRQGIKAEFREHLDNPFILRREDVVFGTLPLNIIAKVNRIGARYFHLDLDVSEAERGKQLSADDMERADARLVEYKVSRGRQWRAGQVIQPGPLNLSYSNRLHRLFFPGWILIVLALSVFLVGLGPNLAANALWGLIDPNSGSNLNSTELCFIGIFSIFLSVFAILFLYSNRGRVIKHGAQIVSDPDEAARPVLITGLSEVDDRTEAATKCLEDLVFKEHVSLARLARTYMEWQTDDPVLSNHVETLKRARWLQNLRAVWYHRDLIEQIIVIPSAESVAQLDRFKALLQAAIKTLNRKTIDILQAGEGVDFEAYDAVQKLIEESLTKAKKKGFRDTDICIDVTPGTKTFSICAAASSFGPERHFLYVNNDGVTRSYNAEMRWASEVSTE